MSSSLVLCRTKITKIKIAIRPNSGLTVCALQSFVSNLWALVHNMFIMSSGKGPGRVLSWSDSNRTSHRLRVTRRNQNHMKGHIKGQVLGTEGSFTFQ